MSRRPSKHDVANLDASSTTNLLPRQTSVQAALLRGPTIRTTFSSNSLVSVTHFIHPAFILTHTFSMSPLILHPWVAGPLWCRRYQRKYVSFYASCMIQPRTHLFFSCSQFSLSPDPASWGSDLSPEHHEPDDYLHNPDPKRDRKNDRGGSIFTCRGLSNLGCLTLLTVFLLTLLFVLVSTLCLLSHAPSLNSAGYPVITYFTKTPLSRQGGFNLGGTNSSGQVRISFAFLPDLTLTLSPTV